MPNVNADCAELGGWPGTHVMQPMQPRNKSIAVPNNSPKNIATLSTVLIPILSVCFFFHVLFTRTRFQSNDKLMIAIETKENKIRTLSTRNRFDGTEQTCDYKCRQSIKAIIYRTQLIYTIIKRPFFNGSLFYFLFSHRAEGKRANSIKITKHTSKNT